MTRFLVSLIVMALALPALAGGTIRGRVTGSTDVRVIAVDPKGVPVAAQGVAPDGRYELAVPAGKFTLHTAPNFGGGAAYTMQAWRNIDCPGHCDKLGELVAVAEGQVLENVDFTLRPKGGRVQGVVTHGTGRGPRVANATITFTSVNDAMQRHTFTAAADGAFAADVPAGTYSVTAFGEGFAPAPPVQITVADKQDQIRDFVVRRLATIRGVVRGDGKPLAGIRIESTGPNRATATTDANGAYTLYDAPGQYTVALADSKVVRVEKSVNAAFDAEVTVDFDVAQRGVLPGRVIDAATGAPVAGATVAVYGFATLTTDDDGRFLFAPDRQPATVTEVTVVARGYARLTQEYDALTIAPGSQVAPVEYKLTRR